MILSDSFVFSYMVSALTCIFKTSVNYIVVLKGGGHVNFDAEFFVPMDSLGDAQVKNNTFKLLKFH